MASLLLAAHFQCWVLGLRYTSVANATLIMSINPMVCAVVERLHQESFAQFVVGL